MKYDFTGHFYGLERFRDFFTFRAPDLITNLHYVLKENFCPCFRNKREGKFILRVKVL